MFAKALFDNIHRKFFIEIKQLPENLDDAFLVAHEMCHAMRYFTKQCVEFGNMPISAMYKEDEIFDMKLRLGSMFDDPLIDKFLPEKYNFNPAHFYTSVIIPDANQGLDSYGDPPYEWHRFKKALFYCQFALQCDLVSDVNVLNEKYKLK
jgi:hypothetical protein